MGMTYDSKAHDKSLRCVKVSTWGYPLEVFGALFWSSVTVQLTTLKLSGLNKLPLTKLS